MGYFIIMTFIVAFAVIFTLGIRAVANLLFPESEYRLPKYENYCDKISKTRNHNVTKV